MLDRNVLCDDCLLNLGVTAVPMTKTDPLAVGGGPGTKIPLGDSYACGCGRLYGSIDGYFTFVEGTGVVRRRAEVRVPAGEANRSLRTRAPGRAPGFSSRRCTSRRSTSR